MRARHHAILAAVLTTVAVVAAPAPAYAATGTGPGGQTLTVNPSSGLSRSGATVTVTGRGFDVNKGIYVAFCVDNGSGAPPGPCGGGADTSGSLGLSHWISSNPPSYGKGLAVPYGSGGSFSISLRVSPTIGDVDCTVRRCVVATRADHTRASDRSQDVKVPVTFAAASGGSTRANPAPAATTPKNSGAGNTAVGNAAAGNAAAAPKPAASATTAAAASSSSAESSAADAPSPVAAGATETEITRVSDASGTGQSWVVGVAALGLALLALVGFGRWRRRRGAAR